MKKILKKALTLMLGASLACTLAVKAGTPVLAAEGQTMLRVYNPNSGEHFYTASVAEKNHLVSLGWRDEGTGWVAPASSNTPVYRLYNANAGDHHYTVSQEERDHLVSVGWKYEGIGWYSDDAKTVSLQRLYNPNAVSGSHHYTVSEGERDFLISAGWRYEGIGWYALAAKQELPSYATPDTKEPYYVNGILIVNKKHALPATYAPGENAEAASQVKKLIADMQALGYNVSSSYSGYRTFGYQTTLYNSYVSKYGTAMADTFSARPGYSEHQTGLTFDLLHWDGTLIENDAAANWIAANAHKYGFIVRYPYGKEAVTGYQAEPWHLRYIGSQAADIYASGLCLEEYLEVEGGDYYETPLQEN
jgi:LAS superfamily LD-carboxypeptidase LdcB